MTVLFDSTVRRSLFSATWLVPLLCALPLRAQAMQRKVPAPAPAPTPARPDSPISVLPARPTDKTPLPSIGSISGTVSWRVGDIAVQKNIMKGSDSTQMMLGLQAWIDTAAHDTYASQIPPSSRRKKVGSSPKYGQITKVGSDVFVHYTISGLPQGVKIWVASEAPAITFQSNQPYGVKCTMSTGLEVNNYNLQSGPSFNFPPTTPKSPR